MKLTFLTRSLEQIVSEGFAIIKPVPGSLLEILCISPYPLLPLKEATMPGTIEN